MPTNASTSNHFLCLITTPRSKPRATTTKQHWHTKGRGEASAIARLYVAVTSRVAYPTCHWELIDLTAWKPNHWNINRGHWETTSFHMFWTKTVWIAMCEYYADRLNAATGKDMRLRQHTAFLLKIFNRTFLHQSDLHWKHLPRHESTLTNRQLTSLHMFCQPQICMATDDVHISCGMKTAAGFSK